MNKGNAEIVAQKYAQACMNVFGDQFSLEDLYAIEHAQDYLSKRPRVFFFLRLAAISNMIKKESLDNFCKQFNLGKPIEKLVQLLIDHKRSFLFAQVLRALAQLYKEQKHIYAFKFVSANALTKQDEQQLQAFLAKQTGYDIIYESIVNEELIAGIRLQSDTLLWEHSIRKQLHTIELQLIR